MTSMDNTSIRWKLVLVTVLTCAIALLFAGSIMAVYDIETFKTQKSQEVTAQAKILAASMSASLAFRDDKAAQEYLDALKVNPEIAAAGAYDADGALFVGYSRADIRAPERAQKEGERFDGDDLTVSMPITDASGSVGSLYLLVSAEPMLTRLARYVGIMLLAVVCSLVVAVPVAMRLNATISNPIQDIVAAASRIIAGDLTPKVATTPRSDEIGLLAKTFDHMVASLRGTMEQFKTVIEASPAAIVSVDSERRVVNWNRAAAQLFGYTADEIVGQPYPLALPEEQQNFEDQCRRLALGAVLRNVESRRRRNDGTVIDTISSAAAFQNSESAIEGIVFIIEDVTERNKVQQQLRISQRMDAIGQLTGGLAHDFNNLIGIVIGNLDLLRNSIAAGTSERELMDDAIEAALRGAELTRQLLAFARQQPLAPKVAHLPATLEATGHLLRRTLGESITLDVRVPDDIWPVLIDISQLDSAIVNLAVNARDAMPNGGRLTIEAFNVALDHASTELHPEATPGDYVAIAVSDSGTGMPPEIIARVFDPFFTTKGTKGTGLGLSMVHGFVKQSGGFTKIYSEPGRGTTIQIYLPRAAESTAARDGEVASSDVMTGTEIVLVVEDNTGMRNIAVRQLRSLGYRTISANDGAQALEILHAGEPVDLLFTDMVMPGGMDGKMLAEAARRLRPGLKVLFTSGFTPAAASAAIAGDFNANLLNKPYRKEDLARRIRAAIESTG